ncbi:MAG: hypothetical protein K0R83_1824 [Caulobacter sp.]|nr:hypothetical protein [Caulobacter sp.]
MPRVTSTLGEPNGMVATQTISAVDIRISPSRGGIIGRVWKAMMKVKR